MVNLSKLGLIKVQTYDVIMLPLDVFVPELMTSFQHHLDSGAFASDFFRKSCENHVSGVMGLLFQLYIIVFLVCKEYHTRRMHVVYASYIITSLLISQEEVVNSEWNGVYSEVIYMRWKTCSSIYASVNDVY